MARLEQVNIVVRDMAAMGAFYERLGVRFRPDRTGWVDHHRSSEAPEGRGADVDLDSTWFASTWDEGWPGGPGVVFGVRVEDRDAVDRTFADLVAAGAVAQQPPYDAFWGARYAVVTDPDGNGVGIMSPVDPSRRSPTPDLP